MGQLADKAHRVHQQRLAAVGQFDGTAHAVQRGEQLIFHVHVRAGEAVEERGLARVGVAYQCHDGHAVLFPALAAQAALALNLFQLVLQIGQALADAAAVDFQLAFARTARADAARQTAEHQALAQQPLAAVSELGHLHLQFALAGAGARGEDVQNQRRAVHYLQAQGLLEVFLHHAGELLVEDDHIGLRGLTAQAQLFRLALSHTENRIGLWALLQDAQHRFGSRRFGQLLQFVQRFLAFDAHQHGALPSRPRGGIGGTVRRVRALDFRKPFLLRQAASADELRAAHMPLAFRIQKGALYACGPAVLAHAHGAHGVKAHAQKRAYVHVAQLARGAGMRMHAAHHAQPPLAAAQAQIRQVDAVGPTDEHVGDLPKARDIHRNFTVHGRRIAAETLKQVLRHELAGFELHVIERGQLVQHGFSDSLGVAMNLWHRPSFRRP